MTQRIALHQKSSDILRDLKKGLDGIMEAQKTQAKLLEKRAAKRSTHKHRVEEMTAGARFIKVLVAASEDIFKMCETLGNINGTKFQTRWQPDVALARQEASKEQFDIILVDCACQKSTMSLVKDARRVPVIVLSICDNHDADKFAMDAGAADFLAGEDLTPKRLEKSIRYCLKNAC